MEVLGQVRDQGWSDAIASNKRISMMNRISRLLGAAAFGVVAATSAAADCQSRLDALLGGAGAADPSVAAGTDPADMTLEQLDPGDGGSEAAGTVPTGSFEGDLDELQKANETELKEMEATDTAPETDPAPADPDREAAIQQARDALAAGDEDACMDALDRASGF